MKRWQTIALIVVFGALLVFVYFKYGKSILSYMFKKDFLWPIFPTPGRVGPGFGWRVHPITKLKNYHNGVDIGAATGTPIKAPQDGTVVNIYNESGGGNQLIFKHDSGYKTGYAHLSAYNVVNGQKVKQGEVLGYVGSTGMSTGPHLHWTLRDPQNNLLDPVQFMNGLT